MVIQLRSNLLHEKRIADSVLRSNFLGTRIRKTSADFRAGVLGFRPQEGSGEECGRGLGIAKKNDIMQLQFNSDLTRFVLTNRRYGHSVPLKHKELLVRVLL